MPLPDVRFPPSSDSRASYHAWLSSGARPGRALGAGGAAPPATAVPRGPGKTTARSSSGSNSGGSNGNSGSAIVPSSLWAHRSDASTLMLLSQVIPIFEYGA